MAGHGTTATVALGVPPERVFKTLIAEVDGTLVTAVVPVPGRLDLRATVARIAAAARPGP